MMLHTYPNLTIFVLHFYSYPTIYFFYSLKFALLYYSIFNNLASPCLLFGIPIDDKLYRMGYTHYFPHKCSFTVQQWQVIKTMFLSVYKKYGELISYESEDPRPPVGDDKMIRFNQKYDGHETFLLTRDQLARFSFCKTARKDYDIVVALVLLSCHMHAPNVLEISSDGDWDDDTWPDARQAYMELFNEESTCPWLA